MKFVLTLILLCFGYVSLAQKGQLHEQSFPPVARYYLWPSNESRYSFFKFDIKRDHDIFSEKYKSATLSKEHLKQIEKLIDEKISQYNKGRRDDDTIKKPFKLYKQIITVTNPKGEKEVWVNCMCSVSESWKTQIERVDDGGNCYCQFKINLTKSIILSFNINGLA
jgi:hypothetical protein